MNQQMQAQLIYQYGGYDAFETSMIPVPTPGPGQVLIKMVATSVNPIDTKLRSGQVGQLKFPALLHSDFSGYIAEVGSGVSDFAIGDAVFGNAGLIAGTGALAEYKLADARLVAPAPESIPLVDAAALPLAGITAWEALFDKAQIKPWHQVLIQGGAGGVGHIASQLALWNGCEVAASASFEKQGLLEAYGVAPLDYAEENYKENALELTDNQEGFDIVFDTVGGKTLDISFELAKPLGSVVAIAGRSTHDLTPVHNKGLNLLLEFKTIKTARPEYRAHQGWILRQLARLIDQKVIVPLIDEREFNLNETGEAHAHLESGEAYGKVLIVINDDEN